MARKYGATNRIRSKVKKWINRYGCGCFYCTGQIDSKFKNKEYFIRLIKKREILQTKYEVIDD